MKSKETKEFYEFGDFRLDEKKRRLMRNGELVSLTPKEFEVLLMLVINAGKPVEKDNLLDKVWADTFVEEGTLTRNISWLRKKLGSDGEKIIETVPKFGYRFLPEVRLIQDGQTIVFEQNTFQKITIEETLDISEPPPLQLPGKSKPSLFWLALVFGVLAISIFGFWLFQRKISPQPIVLTSVVPFSGLAGRENMPAFSPDGKSIAFVWDGDGNNHDIYIKLVGAGEPLRLTNDPANDLFPAFSPDGKSIAFVRSSPSKSEVYLIPALGGAERKICSLESIWSGISFSPDGKTLAVIDADTTNKQWGIFWVNLENGNKKRLTSPPEFVSDINPHFSPDGKQIAFLRVFNQIYEVFTVPVGGGEPKQITNDKTAVSGLTWDEKGNNIIFASRRNGIQSNLWKVSADGGEPEMIVTGGKNIANPTISSDGKQIAFVEELSDTNIWLINPTSNQTAETKLITSSRADHSPSFSPDGKQIVFVSDRTGNFEIWIADEKGKNQRQLTNLSKSAGSPRFSPDGKFVVFDAQDGQKSSVFVISTEGGQARIVTDPNFRAVLPTWSADGRGIYFTSNKSGTYQLWKISVDGGEATQITKQGAFESFAAPNGKTIFHTKARGEAGIWKIGIDGADETQVSGLEDAGFWRYWSVTNDGIYYVSRTPNPPFKVKYYDFKTLQMQDLTSTSRIPIWVYSGFSVSPTDKKILFAQFDQNSASIMLAKLGE
ncbi:MAG: DPP IV N-terminal domain-containing protein [Pyrinomonadaceae bacterium]|nr:DPP IV N-terminal domain-containing protein [Pyrinomonadaceae bacterium]